MLLSRSLGQTPVAEASPELLSDMQIPGPVPRLTASGFLREGPRNLGFNKLPLRFVCAQLREALARGECVLKRRLKTQPWGAFRRWKGPLDPEFEVELSVSR